MQPLTTLLYCEYCTTTQEAYCLPIHKSYLKDMLDDGVRRAKQVCSARVSQAVLQTTGAGGHGFLPQTRDVPDSDSLVQ